MRFMRTVENEHATFNMNLKLTTFLLCSPDSNFCSSSSFSCSTPLVCIVVE